MKGPRDPRQPRHLPIAVSYDPDVDAAYLKLVDFAAGEAVQQRFVEDPPNGAEIILDFNSQGMLLGVEVLSASRVLSPEILK